jgi:acetate kinase
MLARKVSRPEHDPEKACPALDAGWIPVFGKRSEKLEWLGTSIDPAANAANALRISPPQSRVAVLVVPTDAEFMIARHTVALLSERRARQPNRKRA